MDSMMAVGSYEPDHTAFVDLDLEPDRSASDPSYGGKVIVRKPNWTDHEIRALIEGYDRNRALLRTRGSGERGANNLRRNAVWEEIAMEVNKSRPDMPVNMTDSPFTNCLRTTKEVVKKWVNLVNRMKSDIALKRSDPHHELGPVARAVYTIVSTDEPLHFRENTMTPEDHMAPENPVAPENHMASENHMARDNHMAPAHIVIKEEVMDYYGEDSAISVEESNPDYSQTSFSSNDNFPTDATSRIVTDAVNSAEESSKSRPAFVPNNIKAAILKRHQLHNHSNDDPDPDYRPRGAKKRKLELVHKNDMETRSRRHSEIQSTDGGSAMTETDKNLKATYKLDKDIMELQRRKLEVEVEKMLVEKRKAQIEKEHKIIEKEMTLLKKEKLQMEVEKMRRTLNNKVMYKEDSFV